MKAEAKKLLSWREKDRTFIDSIKGSKRILITRLIILIACEYIFLFVNPDPLYLFVSGLLLGSFVQDFGWFWKASKLWSFTKSITDWEKVKEIAESS